MSLDNKWALITGASSGMGKDYAHILAKKKMNLVLTARREDLLTKLKDEIETSYGVKVKLIVKDLSKKNCASEIFSELKSETINIEVLINNAGFGMHDNFKEQNLGKILNMIDLNIKSLVSLTKIFTDDMLTRKSGYVLNIGSIAGYTAIPTYAAYGATKAFVMNFGQAINTELKGTGVSVSTLNPGTTRTEFFDVSGHKMTPIQKAAMMDSMIVSEIGINGMLKRKSIIIPGIRNIMLIILMKLSPRAVIANTSYSLMKKN